MTSFTMTESVIIKNGFWIGVVALLQVVAPSAIAVSFLYFLVFTYDAHFKEYFYAMAVLVALLMVLLPYPNGKPQDQILSGNVPLVISVLVRWSIVLALLLAIAYVTKFSDHYSRRIVLTWAVVTPALLVPVTVVLQETMRRLMCDPQNARRTVFVGYNEVSRSLATQLRTIGHYCMSVQGFFDDRDASRLQTGPQRQVARRVVGPRDLGKEARRRRDFRRAARSATYNA